MYLVKNNRLSPKIVLSLFMSSKNWSKKCNVHNWYKNRRKGMLLRAFFLAIIIIVFSSKMGSIIQETKKLEQIKNWKRFKVEYLRILKNNILNSIFWTQLTMYGSSQVTPDWFRSRNCFSNDNLAIFWPILMKLEMWVDINQNLSPLICWYAWVTTGHPD